PSVLLRGLINEQVPMIPLANNEALLAGLCSPAAPGRKYCPSPANWLGLSADRYCFNNLDRNDSPFEPNVIKKSISAAYKFSESPIFPTRIIRRK
ncbi:MAG: hypothetical protein L0Y74_11455, partial [candidate division Zixibacteria bacterium]|nr:hypothetical protein [candidate division Zixibacteria bacterium]